MATRRCGVCGREREIAMAARDGRPDTCRSCYRPPVRECSLCGRERACLFATSDAPVCLSCRARTASRLEPCAVCCVRRRVVWRSLDGPVCERCRDHHLRSRARCGRCGQLRRPSSPVGEPVCCTCAGVTTEPCCERCGQEAAREERGLCARCALVARLDALRAGADQHALGRLEPYLRALAASEPAPSALLWVRFSPAFGVLARLARGELELTHEALDALEQPAGTTTITFLRARRWSSTAP
jgi:hypothetical protein